MRLNELRQIDVSDPILLLDLTASEQSRNALKNLSFFYSFKDQPEDLHLLYQHTKPAMTLIEIQNACIARITAASTGVFIAVRINDFNCEIADRSRLSGQL